ncbi:MAG: hypothetical protein AAF699_10195 [Pseudomonadota bacterium]
MKGIILTMLTLAVALHIHAQEVKTVDNVPVKVSSAKAVVPIYSQRVAFQLPADWKPAFQDQNAAMFMMEFTPKDEDTQNWSNMFSIQGFKNLAARTGAEGFLDNLASGFAAACGENRVYEKYTSPDIDGFETATAVLGCAEMPADHPTGVKKGQSEIGVYYAIKGEKDIYLIHRSIRGAAFEPSDTPITQANVESLIRPFSPLEVCKNTGGPAQCLK